MNDEVVPRVLPPQPPRRTIWNCNRCAVTNDIKHHHCRVCNHFNLSRVFETRLPLLPSVQSLNDSNSRSAPTGINDNDNVPPTDVQRDVGKGGDGIIVRITTDHSTDVLIHAQQSSTINDLYNKYLHKAILVVHSRASLVLPNGSQVHSDCPSTLVDKGISMGSTVMVIMSNNHECDEAVHDLVEEYGCQDSGNGYNHVGREEVGGGNEKHETSVLIEHIDNRASKVPKSNVSFLQFHLFIADVTILTNIYLLD
jgi:hypothetical protein